MPMLRSTSTSWGLFARSLHWTTLLLVVLAWLLVEAHEWFPRGSAAREALMSAHYMIGSLVAVMIVVRVFAKLAGRRPESLVSPLQERAARAVQWGMLLLLLALPVTGASYLVLDGHADALLLPTSWFEGVAVNEPLAERVEDIHKDVLFPLLVVLLLGHAGAALHHHFSAGSAILRRMWRGQ